MVGVFALSFFPFILVLCVMLWVSTCCKGQNHLDALQECLLYGFIRSCAATCVNPQVIYSYFRYGAYTDHHQ